ncbi:hypothetical protein EXD76_00190 [BEV proteobacterium]|nr:hypothetical protein [Candidatus Symbiopectobacterium sp. Chty_BC]
MRGSVVPPECSIKYVYSTKPLRSCSNVIAYIAKDVYIPMRMTTGWFFLDVAACQVAVVFAAAKRA